MTLRKSAFERAIDIWMHYHIFIVDNGFKPAWVTLVCVAPQFHGCIGGFWQ